MEPGIYQTLDMLRGTKGNGEIDWPDYCELPISAAYTYLANEYDEKTAANLCAELTQNAADHWEEADLLLQYAERLARAGAASKASIGERRGAEAPRLYSRKNFQEKH